MRPSRLTSVNEEETRALLGAACRILDETGILVKHQGAVGLLESVGGRVDSDGRVRVDPGLVEDFVRRAPGRFRLYDRAGGSIEIGSGRSWTMCGGTVSRVADWPSWSARPASRADVVAFARLCDALPLVHCVVPMAEAQDVPSEYAEVITFAETIANTSKFILVCPVRHENAVAWVEMGKAVAGCTDLSGAPSIGLLVSVLPSLHLDDDCAATTLLAAREGLPLVILGGAIAGSSAPNTVAAACASKLAAELFVAVLAQAAQPGTPVMLSTGVVPLDMKSADIGEAGPEYPLGIATMAPVLQHLGLATYSCAVHCEAKTGDFQAGLEKMGGLIAASLAGVDLTTNLGMLSRCSVASSEQLVMDHEMCAWVDRFCSGVSVTDDTLAEDVVREVGPGGPFITHEHTARHCRSGEIWYPELLDRTSIGAPQEDLYDRAHSRVERLLSAHRPAVEVDIHKSLTKWL